MNFVYFGFFLCAADPKIRVWDKMHTRLMERTNSMRGKRPMEGGEEEQAERKRPALAR